MYWKCNGKLREDPKQGMAGIRYCLQDPAATGGEQTVGGVNTGRPPCGGCHKGPGERGQGQGPGGGGSYAGGAVEGCGKVELTGLTVPNWMVAGVAMRMREESRLKMVPKVWT